MRRAYHPLAVIGQVRARARRQADRRIPPATPEPWQTVAIAEPEQPYSRGQLIGEEGTWRWESESQRGTCNGMAHALQQTALQVAAQRQDDPSATRRVLFANGHRAPVRIEAAWTRATHAGDDAMRAWAGLGEIEVRAAPADGPAGKDAVEVNAANVAEIGTGWTHESIRRDTCGREAAL